MNSFKLPNGAECRVDEGCFVIEDIHLTLNDVAELTRQFFTLLPLRPGDVRLRLVDEIRAAIIKEDTKTHKRWFVLDALRSVTMKKLLAHRKATDE